MNIRDHIEQGHYPVDSKGRALVPHREGGVVVVCATDMPGSCPILGYRVDAAGNRTGSTGADSGFGYWADTKSLLPPPPRKVEVKRWCAVKLSDGTVAIYSDDPFKTATGYALVELTGSYEEPWS